PDFRSSERTFQLLTQVAGRAGRGKIPGRVLIQTYSPDHPSIRFAERHDYLSFYKQEVEERWEHGYPPFRQIINTIIRSRVEKHAYVFARALRDSLTAEWPNAGRPENDTAVELIGPAPLPFYRLRGHFRWHVMIKAPRGRAVAQDLLRHLAKIKKPSSVAAVVDVDPLNIL
ncbi:MAG: primosomal protein N', partial [Candidatus Omnitrophica bacterium]|nr:primosomal protein N' [Candidatus Omnitrophota bacterium]